MEGTVKRASWLLTVVLLGACLSGWAQIPTGSIVGTVTDSTGAVVPNAKVTVANPQKAFTRDFTSNTAGEYAAVSIPLGDYTVTAEASGFQKLVRSGITLTVGQTQRVDLALSVGQVTQEVTVTGNVVRVETENAAVSDLVNSQQISKLSLNGRNWVTLALLTPGAVPDNGLNTTVVGVEGNNSISFNGGRMQYNNWEIDGGNNTDEGSASTFNTYPSLDAISEFRISTSNYGADFGKHSGATIELATKSGTKDFHGDVYEYNRNSAVAANPFFQNRVINPPGGNAPITQLNWNDWGYTIGGPVYIPHHYNTDKSKSFFFWSEEWRRQRQGQVVSAGVPSALERTGNFSECDKSSPNYNSAVASGCVLPSLTVGGVKTSYDTVQAMPGFNANAYQNGLDLVNGLVPLANSGPVDWTSSSSTGVNWRQELIRWDQNISDKAQFFFRYTQDTWDTLSVPALWQWASYDTIKTPFSGPGESAVMHITYSFKPNLMNEFLAAYTTDHIYLGNQPGTSCGGPCQIDRPANFQMNHFYTSNDSNPLLPGIELCGGLSFCTSEATGNFPWENANPIITWKDNVVWTHGTHTTKFGFYLENYRKNEQFGTATQGYLSNGAGGSLTTGNAMADMFLGRIQQYQEGAYVVNGVPVGGYAKGHWQMTDLEPYIQDDWKVTRKLTVNLGLRWYLYTRNHDVTQPQTIDSGFWPQLYNVKAQDPLIGCAPNCTSPSAVNGNINTAVGLSNFTNYGNGLVECGVNGVPLGCQLNNTFKNFAPRFGFAFDPKGDGKTVVRGGFGIYFESGNGNESQTEGAEGNPPASQSPSGFNIGPTAAQPNGYLNIIPGAIGPTGYTALPGNQGWPYVMQFSFGVQHEFRGNNLLSVGYVGSLGRALARNWTISQMSIPVGNQTVPSLAGVTGTDKTGLGLNPSCSATGVCNVQALLINNVVPSTFFQNYIGYNNMQMKQNGANSNYNSLQVNFRHAFSHGLTLQAVYTWSHSLDNSTSTYQQTPGQIDGLFNYQRWYGTSDLNRTNVLTFNYVYDLPFFKNSSSAFVKAAFGGWEVSGITTFYTGEPITFNCGVSGFSTGIGGAMGCNPVGPVKIDKTIVDDPTYGPTVGWYNPANITQPLASQLLANNQPGMFGYMGRNFLTGPGANNWDLTLLKNFNMPWFKGEKATWQFRWETYNTWNHTQWGPFDGNGASGVNTGCLSSTPFGGTCTGSSGGQLLGTVNSTYSPRVMQFGLKFIF
jgi:hypothetical protein